MRRKIIVGNWKMYKTLSEAVRDYNAFVVATEDISSHMDLGFAVPSVFLDKLGQISNKKVKVFAQNCHWEKEGAFTGETSAQMLVDLKVSGSLVAHSERRQYFGETNITSGKRAQALLSSKLETIFCIGETLAQRQAGELSKILHAQITEAFKAANISSFAQLGWSDASSAPLLSIAYEPVWAIGTGLAATPVEAQEAHLLIRHIVHEEFGHEAASKLRILYGGSVNTSNVSSFMKCADIDGALVGGASLKPDAFADLCRGAL